MIITTGGTIDKDYCTGAGVRDLTFGDRSAVTDILRQIRTYQDYPVLRLMAKDSLDIGEQERQTIAALCSALPHERILITHGTDTMDKTAAALAAKNIPKTIILTGAGQPAVMKGSDADFNVGFALSAALLVQHGVYIAMNAQLYNWDKCKKNPGSGIFEPYKSEQAKA